MFKERSYQIFKDDLVSIKNDIEYATKLNESLADKRSYYRRFALNVAKINEQSLLKIGDLYQYGLLISCYTFSERLVKHFVYNILELQDGDDVFNNHQRKILLSKFPKKRYVPNVEFEGIHGIFSSFLDIPEDIIGESIKILNISKFSSCYKGYEKMVKYRHEYAHTGSHQGFTIDVAAETYIILELLLDEIDNINNNFSSRMKLQYNVDELTKVLKILQKKSRIVDKREIRIPLKRAKDISKEIVKILRNLNFNSQVYKYIDVKCVQLSQLDLRKSWSVLHTIIKSINI